MLSMGSQSSIDVMVASHIQMDLRVDDINVFLAFNIKVSSQCLQVFRKKRDLFTKDRPRITRVLSSERVRDADLAVTHSTCPNVGMLSLPPATNFDKSGYIHGN